MMRTVSSTAVSPPVRGAKPVRGRRIVCCSASDTKSRSAKDVRAGFKWDPAYSRWVRDDKLTGKVDANVVIQPKSGPAYTIWPVIHTDLVDFGLEGVECQEGLNLQKSGCVMLDVRVKEKYDAGHITGSINIPLFRPVQGDGFFDNLKRVAMGSFAMKATERDPDFAKKVEEEIGKDKKLILVCDIGGTLSTKVSWSDKKKDYEMKDPERAFGRESRSLKAAHALIESGFDKLSGYLEGGYQRWKYDGFPVEST